MKGRTKIMKVKVLKPHQNACGAKVSKEKGDEYDCSERTAKQLAALGLVEIVKDEEKSTSKAGK
jgi:hypothetical protein